MYRIRISLPPRRSAQYRHQDLLHDALVNAWTEAGADADAVIGTDARPWTFAALGTHHANLGRVHTLVVATPDSDLAGYLRRFDPAAIRQARAITAEAIDFADAGITPEADPLAPGCDMLGCFLLSPLAISEKREPGGKKVWRKNLNGLDLATPVNKRLSRLAGRPVNLRIHADSLYLRANPRHSVLVSLKRMRDGRHAFVIGMQAPLLLSGSEDDLRFAWYAGIGEKTRNGFGCLGLIERGVGR
jgi:hypothetical protein